MANMRRKRTITFCMAVSCLLLGSAIYVLFRPTSLLMFHWADAFGMTASIDAMRIWLNGFDKYLPIWVVYSLPFALWVSSYLFFIKGIWWNSASLAHNMWFWCIPIIAIVSEFAQTISLIPGHFDPLDMVTIVFGTILSLKFVDFNKLNQGESK